MLEKVEQTDSFEDRMENAQVTLDTLGLSLPTVVDKEDNRVNIAYAGWPDRLYIVGTDGKIAYKGGPGPKGFKTGEVEEWLRANAK